MQSADCKFPRLRVSNNGDYQLSLLQTKCFEAMYNATDIKSFQYVLIVPAGLAVSEKKEMCKAHIENEVYIEFTQGVEKCKIPSNLQGINSALFLRSKNFLGRTCLDSDLHTGDSLWRKYAEIKKIICNDFTDLYSKFLLGGQPPSGLSMEDILEKTRVAVFMRYEEKKNKDTQRQCPSTWVPT